MKPNKEKKKKKKKAGAGGAGVILFARRSAFVVSSCMYGEFTKKKKVFTLGRVGNVLVPGLAQFTHDGCLYQKKDSSTDAQRGGDCGYAWLTLATHRRIYRRGFT